MDFLQSKALQNSLQQSNKNTLVSDNLNSKYKKIKSSISKYQKTSKGGDFRQIIQAEGKLTQQ